MSRFSHKYFKGSSEFENKFVRLRTFFVILTQETTEGLASFILFFI